MGTIWIETRRYSAVLRRILEAYGDRAEVRIDSQVFRGPAVADLLATWCTNARIQSTRDFLVIRDGEKLFGFHDSPSELWAASSEREFVEQLRSDRLVRLRTSQDTSGPSLLARLLRNRLFDARFFAGGLLLACVLAGILMLFASRLSFLPALAIAALAIFVVGLATLADD